MRSFSDPGNLARYIRVYLGKSQQAVANETGMDIRDVAHIEQGRKNLRVWKFVRLAAYYHIALDDLLFDRFAPAISNLPAKPRRNTKPLKALHRYLRRCETLGQEGEKFVASLERKKLRGTPFAHGVNEAVADDLCAGYDIQSCDLDGSPIYIEVKTTNGDVSEPMHLSSGELEFAEYCYANDLRYELHRVYHLHNNRFPPARVIFSVEQVLALPREPSDYILRGC